METKRLPSHHPNLTMELEAMELQDAYHGHGNWVVGSLVVWLQLLKDRFKSGSLFAALPGPQKKEDFQRVYLPNKRIMAEAFPRELTPIYPYPGALRETKAFQPSEKPPGCWQEAEELAKTGYFEWQAKTGFFHCSANTGKLVNSQLSQQDLSFPALLVNFSEADQASLKESWTLLLRQQKEIDHEARITDLFGDKWIKIKAKAIWEKSTVVKITGFLQDITETKVLELKLREACQTAEQDAKARTRFVSEVSHEIRTPLNAISGFTYLLLQEEVSREEQQDYLRSIQFSTQNLLSLINETLDFAKIEAGKVEFEHIPFPFHELLQDLHRSFYLRAAEKKVALTLDISAGTPEVAVGDPAKLCQILNNLVSNAIKFTGEGEVKIAVEVVYESETDWVLELSVSDTGVGIPADKQALIFESFTQANAATKRQYGGTGLGLAITKKLVELQQGKIQLHSVPGQGSEFIVCLKLAKPDPNHQGLHLPDLSLNQFLGLQGARILVVDDNALNRSVASKLLTNWQVQVDTAENGLEALKKLQLARYDVILMDLFMPVMDGFEAIAQLKSLGFKTPVIALTGNTPTEEENKLLEAGVHDFVTKPFKPQDLYKTILDHLILN